jgi:hypothetical protein
MQIFKPFFMECFLEDDWIFRGFSMAIIFLKNSKILRMTSGFLELKIL